MLSITDTDGDCHILVHLENASSLRAYKDLSIKAVVVDTTKYVPVHTLGNKVPRPYAHYAGIQMMCWNSTTSNLIEI